MCCWNGFGAMISWATVAPSMSTFAGCAKRSSRIPAGQSTSRRFVALAIASRYLLHDETRRPGDEQIIDRFCLLVSWSPCLFMTALNIILALAFLVTLGWA